MSYQQEYYQPQQPDMNFQQFNYEQKYTEAYNYDQTLDQTNLRHDLPFGVTWESIKRAFSTGGFDNEPPLMEGIQY
jgi:hypothetical protein